jgi:hypothetical protein
MRCTAVAKILRLTPRDISEIRRLDEMLQSAAEQLREACANLQREMRNAYETADRICALRMDLLPSEAVQDELDPH